MLLRVRRSELHSVPILDFWGPYTKLCRVGGGGNETHLSVFHSSRIALAKGARETVSLRGTLSTRFFFSFSNKRLYDIHVTLFD